MKSKCVTSPLPCHSFSFQNTTTFYSLFTITDGVADSKLPSDLQSDCSASDVGCPSGNCVMNGILETMQVHHVCIMLFWCILAIDFGSIFCNCAMIGTCQCKYIILV